MSRLDDALKAANRLARAELAYEKAKPTRERCDKCGRRPLPVSKERRSKKEASAYAELVEARAAWKNEYRNTPGLAADIVHAIRKELTGGD